MTVAEETYTTPPPRGKARTLTALRTNSSFSRPNKHLGSKYPPLLALEPSQYVLDELHLLLRVSDILLRNLIHLADHMDQTNQLRGGETWHSDSTARRYGEVVWCGFSNIPSE